MSTYYNAQRTTRLYDPSSDQPFRLSRSKIDLFINCPRCFYLDRRLGVGPVPGYPFNLNSAVDHLLKKEFDVHRASGKRHPICEKNEVDAVPFQHEKMDEWRDSLRRGITYDYPETNLRLCGGIDDVWVNPAGELLIVDYKVTSKDGEVSLDAPWQDGYKRQMEIYQWLFRKNGFTVSDTGYFVYVNGRRDAEAFNAKLEFDVRLLPYTGDGSWVDVTIRELHECLSRDVMPEASEACDSCNYYGARSAHERTAGS